MPRNRVNQSRRLLPAFFAAALAVSASAGVPQSSVTISEMNGVPSNLWHYDLTPPGINHFYSPFGALSGGVTVAAGDIDGDGFDDVIAAPASGGAGGHVRVFSGVDGTQIASFFAFEGLAGGVSLAAADVDGDGRVEIAVGIRNGASNGHVKVFDGVTGDLRASFFAFPGATQGVTLGMGDFNGDRWADIVVGLGAGAPNGHVKVFDGRSGNQLASFFAFPGFNGGVNVAAGDIDGDGRADIIAGAGAGAAGGHVKVFRGIDLLQIKSFFAFEVNFMGGVNVSSGDLNGDGYDDVFTGSGPGRFTAVRVFSGENNVNLQASQPFLNNTAGGYVAGRASYKAPCKGDANGDGVVNFSDITEALASFNADYLLRGPGDADGSGNTDFTDVTTVLANFGAACR
jgi:hypothetical protein